MAQLIGISINDSRVVEFLKQEIKLKAVYRQILCREIVYREAEERGLVVTPEEIQTEADQFRYQHKLESASQTYDWLEDQLITTDDWEIGIQARLLSRKLAEYLFEEQVKTYFAQNKVK
jgi:site-specific recombinase XerD